MSSGVTSVESQRKEVVSFLETVEFSMAIGDSRFSFTGQPIPEWLKSIEAVTFTGVTYAVNFGPFPFTPTARMVDQYDIFFRMYGARTHFTLVEL